MSFNLLKSNSRLRFLSSISATKPVASTSSSTTTTTPIATIIESISTSSPSSSVAPSPPPKGFIPNAPTPAFSKHIPIKPKHGIHVATLHLRSHTSSLPSLTFFTSFALRAARALNLPTSGSIALPTRTSLFTVPRSPFAHKKSQENFWRKEHKRGIKVFDGQEEVVRIWLAYLRKEAMGGVGMKAQIFRYKEVGYGEKMINDDDLRQSVLEDQSSDSAKVAATAEELIAELSAAATLASEKQGAAAAMATEVVEAIEIMSEELAQEVDVAAVIEDINIEPVVHAEGSEKHVIPEIAIGKAATKEIAKEKAVQVEVEEGKDAFESTKAHQVAPVIEDIASKIDQVAPGVDSTEKKDDTVDEVAREKAAELEVEESKEAFESTKAQQVAPVIEDIASKVDQVAPVVDSTEKKIGTVDETAREEVHELEVEAKKVEEEGAKAEMVAPKIEDIAAKVEEVAPATKVDPTKL